MATKSSTPLWLELRKEYIDDNFEQLLNYLRQFDSVTQKDTFYETTLKLLHDRVGELTQKVSSKPIYQEPDDESITTYNVRLMASYLLASPDGDVSLQAYVAMMSELRRLVPKFSDQLLQTTFDRLRNETIANIGFGWNDIIDFKDELFAFHATKYCQFKNKLKKPLTYENFGTAVLNADGLFLTPGNKKDALKLQSSGANSLDTAVGLTLRTVSHDKLKQSDSTHLSAMDDFVKDFVNELWNAQKKTNIEHKFHYADGEDLIVRITEIDRSHTIHVETIDPKYEKVIGTIHFGKPNFVYYSSSLFPKYLQVGDCLRATLLNSERKLFDISKHFIKFVTEDCRDQYGMGTIHAKLLYKNPKSLVWMNQRGTHLYSKYSDDYQIGDMADLEISQYSTGSDYGKILTYIEGPFVPDDETNIDEEEVRELTIGDFADTTPVPSNIMQKDELSQPLSPVVLRLLVRYIFDYQKTLLKPSERYCFLANARVMSEMTDDELAGNYIQFASSYLRVLVQFASNESIGNINLEPESEFKEALPTRIRLAVVNILKEYGRRDNSEILADTISKYEESIPILARLARLVQTANTMQGTLSDASINVIKREIIKTLSLETENDTDLEADSGIYLGVESGTMEFKTSFVYPSNNNMQPNETAQELNVFRGICAFLNSDTGGTLYLGVNDSGYVSGIENDLNFLHKSIDAYIRHIQDRAKHYFDTDGIVYLRMESLYDNRVVAIHVEPHPYRVVELNGTAYLRVNAESREMPEKVKLALIDRKVFKDKNKAAAISQLQHACSQQRCVILHSYASSNSQSVKDRFVEAYDVRPDDDLVMCYDRNTASANKLKVFNINRIGWVEILPEKWQFPASHKKINVDAFHMSGDTPIHISLQLNLMAKNLLVEEYPSIKPDLTPDSKDPGVWYLNTNVYSIYGIGRFYIGLANAIKIIHAPELKAYADEFVKQYLQ